MNKPNNYDNTRAGGDYTPIELGGHRAIIKQVEETKSRSGKDMIIVSIDFAQEDKQPHYFADQYKADTRDPKKWPFQAVSYIMAEDANGNTNRSFKGFCTAYEDSNGVSINWGNGSQWPEQFKNRRIGVVYREEESEYNGEFRIQHRIAWFCNDHKALDQDIPARKALRNGSDSGSATASAPATNGDEWLPTDFSADELPFR